MRVAVFGSTGLTGRLLVAQALEAGHDVVAFARHPGKLADMRSERLRVVPGQLSDSEAVTRAVAGADAVISVLGPGVRIPGVQLSEGVRTIIDVMHEQGVRRLVVLSTASLTDPLDRPDPSYARLVSAIKLIFRAAYDEVIRMGGTVRASETDWTIVRIGLLTNKPAGAVRVGHYGRGEVGMGISRASLAAFMLELAVSGEHVHESLAVSN